MFRTNDRSQAAVPPAATIEGDRHWYTVDVRLQHIWFVASFAWPADKADFPHTLILADLSQITRATTELGATIKQVVLVSPSAINGTDRWLFEDLVEAWECDTKVAPNTPAMVYVVASGNEYADSFLRKPAQLRKVQRVFPIERFGNQAAN